MARPTRTPAVALAAVALLVTTLTGSAALAQTAPPQLTIGHGPTSPTPWSVHRPSPLHVSRIPVPYETEEPTGPTPGEATPRDTSARETALAPESRIGLPPRRELDTITRPERARYQLIREDYVTQPDGYQFVRGVKIWTLEDRLTGTCLQMVITAGNRDDDQTSVIACPR